VQGELPPVVVKVGGRELPPTLSVSRYRAEFGDDRTDRAVRMDCEAGKLPTLPRRAGSGQRHRIIVTKLLESLGIPYEVGTASAKAA